MNSSIIEISDFIYSIFDNSYDSNLILEKLILLDNDILLELVSLMKDGKVTKENLLSIGAITNLSITNLINRYKVDNQDEINKRILLIEQLNNNLNFSAEKSMQIVDFQNYLKNSLISGSSHMVQPNYNVINPTQSFNNYNKLISIYTGSLRSNLVLNEKLNNFRKKHNSIPYRSNYLMELIEMCINEPIFIDSVFNKNRLTNYQVLVDILNKKYRFTSVKEFNGLYDSVLDGIVKSSGNEDIKDYGWDYIKVLIQNSSWSNLADYRGNVVEEFQRIRIIRTFYAKVYSRYNMISNYQDDLVITRDIIKYLDMANDILTTISGIIKRVNSEL